VRIRRAGSKTFVYTRVANFSINFPRNKQIWGFYQGKLNGETPFLQILTEKTKILTIQITSGGVESYQLYIQKNHQNIILFLETIPLSTIQKCA
jgi:hypothetical protein